MGYISKIEKNDIIYSKNTLEIFGKNCIVSGFIIDQYNIVNNAIYVKISSGTALFYNLIGSFNNSVELNLDLSVYDDSGTVICCLIYDSSDMSLYFRLFYLSSNGKSISPVYGNTNDIIISNNYIILGAFKFNKNNSEVIDVQNITPNRSAIYSKNDLLYLTIFDQSILVQPFNNIYYNVLNSINISTGGTGGTGYTGATGTTGGTGNTGKTGGTGGTGRYGIPGAGKSYLHIQNIPDSMWCVKHNLNEKYVFVQCINEYDQMVLPKGIKFQSPNSLLILFGIETAGYAVCVGGRRCNYGVAIGDFVGHTGASGGTGGIGTGDTGGTGATGEKGVRGFKGDRGDTGGSGGTGFTGGSGGLGRTGGTGGTGDSGGSGGTGGFNFQTAEDGQVIYINNHNYEFDYILKDDAVFVDNDLDLSLCKSSQINIIDVANYWIRVNMDNNDPDDAWTVVDDTVYSNVNSVGLIGFVNPTVLDNYTAEVTVKSTGWDDDAMGIVLSYLTIGDTQHSLFLYRSHGGYSLIWGLYYFYGPIDGTPTPTFIAADKFRSAISNLDPYLYGPNTGHGWDTSPTGSKIYAKRTGNIFEFKCSNFDSTTYVDGSYVSIDLNNYPILDVFKRAGMFGYGAISQQYATFADANIIYNTRIYDVRNGDRWDLNNEAWDLSTTNTLYNDYKPGRFLYSGCANKTFFYSPTKIDTIAYEASPYFLYYKLLEFTVTGPTSSVINCSDWFKHARGLHPNLSEDLFFCWCIFSIADLPTVCAGPYSTSNPSLGDYAFIRYKTNAGDYNSITKQLAISFGPTTDQGIMNGSRTFPGGNEITYSTRTFATFLVHVYGGIRNKNLFI